MRSKSHLQVPHVQAAREVLVNDDVLSLRKRSFMSIQAKKEAEREVEA